MNVCCVSSLRSRILHYTHVKLKQLDMILNNWILFASFYLVVGAHR